MKLTRRAALAAAAAAGGRGAGLKAADAAGPPRSNVLTLRLHDGRGADYFENVTLASLSNLEAPARRVRLVFANDKREPWRLDGACVAPTAEAGDGLRPAGADGSADPSLWRRVTFGGAERIEVPADPNASLAQPSLTFSDWADVPALARRDGGPGALLLSRSYSKSGARYFTSGGAPDAALGRVFKGFWGGDDGTRPESATEWAARARGQDGRYASFGLQYETAAAGCTLVGVGDSIMASDRTTSSISGFGVRACATVSSATVPVSYVNEGASGRKSVDYLADGLADLRLFKPQAMLIQAWSENDPLTAEGAEACLAGALALGGAAEAAGCVPILVTAAPALDPLPRYEPVRAASVARLRALGAAGWRVLDLDAIWGSGAVPNAYQPRYDSGDRTHPNDAACAAAAAVLAEMLRAALALR